MTFLSAGKQVCASTLAHSNTNAFFWKVLTLPVKIYWMQHISSFLSSDLSVSRTSYGLLLLLQLSLRIHCCRKCFNFRAYTRACVYVKYVYYMRLINISFNRCFNIVLNFFRICEIFSGSCQRIVIIIILTLLVTITIAITIVLTTVIITYYVLLLWLLMIIYYYYYYYYYYYKYSYS